MSKINCPECGTENELGSKFCQKCGVELKSPNNTDKNENPQKGVKGWWNNQSSNNKKLIGVGGCCGGILIFFVLMMILFPVTALSIDQTQVKIDNQTTEYTIQGKTEPNAAVTITSQLLNLNDTPINVDSNGNFSYKVSIPTNVTEVDVNISAKSPKKSQAGLKINIKRETPTPTPAPTNTTNTTVESTPTPAAPTPKTVTISQLYGTSIPEGTLVKVSGTVIESDGSRLRIKNSNNKDIMVEGIGLSAYEGQSVTVTGTFYGPSSYDTAIGGSRTVPFLEDGTIV